MKCVLEALGAEKNGPSQISGWAIRMNGGVTLTGKEQVYRT